MTPIGAERAVESSLPAHRQQARQLMAAVSDWLRRQSHPTAPMSPMSMARRAAKTYRPWPHRHGVSFSWR